MKILFRITLILLGSYAILSVNPPTDVLVIESTACGNCIYFNYYDVRHLTKYPEYEKVVNIRLNPSANLIRSKNADGTYSFKHRSGDVPLRKALALNCVNNLYTNDIALKWAASSSNWQNNSLEVELSKFFTEDKGAKVLSCVNSKDALQYTNKAYDQYLNVATWGMLPFIFLNGSKELFNNDDNKYFLENICNIRPDRQELAACRALSSSSNEELFSESYAHLPTKENEVFDYENFWNTPDDDY